MFPTLLAVEDAVLALQDALANGGYVVAAVIAVLILVPIILKAFKVQVPFLDPLLEVLLGIAKSFVKPKPAAAEVPPEKPAEGVSEVSKVHDINELRGPRP